jgi:hypothetical protein
MIVDNMELSIPISKLMEYNVTLQQWFVLYCLHSRDRQLIEDYIEKCGRISTIEFSLLRDKGLIILHDPKEIRFDSASLTAKARELFFDNRVINIATQFDNCFKELRDTFPSKVPANNGTYRRLQGDLTRCRKLYYKILVNKGEININLHKQILNAIRKQYLEFERGRRLPFFQSLSVYLHQQNYEAYLEEENNIEDEFSFSDDI